MTFFVYLDTQFASDASSAEEAIEEATTQLIERLQRAQAGERDQVEWLIEEEE
jgi:hypothetical protein|tara:strand:+ start:551 stop:709 length:159 start_codon:yes stop_codon:yes gene_type:complete